MASVVGSICEKYLRALCPGLTCQYTHHFDLPYIWQVCLDGPEIWSCLPPEANVRIEHAYCMPHNDHEELEVEFHKDGVQGVMPFHGDFNKMEARVLYMGTIVGPFAMRRLSTCSYGQELIAKETRSAEEDAEISGFVTQWRWYYRHGSCWKQFEAEESVMQSVLEMKFLAGQEVYQFQVPVPEPSGSSASASKSPSTSKTSKDEKMIYLLSFVNMTVERSNTESKENCTHVRRRPLFLPPDNVLQKAYLPSPTWKPTKYLFSLPDQWYPIDFTQHYEMVPLNPDGVEFHLVASEFLHKLKEYKIDHIFRIQNPFLWQRFLSKKQYMDQHEIPLNELQLFHGTQTYECVLAILKQNFDWRVSGKNATVYGKGSYFARNASLSNKYTGDSSKKSRWMFLARVLTGRSVRGHRDYLRPPPIDAAIPDGDLYDSCVDKETNPDIHVIYDSDQCYPEYLINYQDNE